MKTPFACALLLVLFASSLVFAQTGVGNLSFTLKNQAVQENPASPTPAAAVSPAAPASPAAAADPGDSRIRNAGVVILRAEPRLESAAVAQLDANDRITVLERIPGWKKVRCAKGTGYLRSYYLLDPKDPDPSPASSAGGSGTATSGGSTASVSSGSGITPGKKKNIYSQPVHMRSAKSADANCPGIIPPGGDVIVLAVEGDWALVESGGAKGYVRTAYVGDTPPPNNGGRIVTSGGQTPYAHPGDIPPSRPLPTTNNTPQNNVSGGQPPATHGDGGSGRFGGRPVDGGRVTSEYGPRVIFGRQSYHNGIDVGVPTGTPAKAVGDGKVVKTGWDNGGGKYIDVKYDNGYSSRYYHMKDFTVQAGARVSQGQVIGHTDNTGAYTTGAHLHAEFKNPQGQFVNPRQVPGLKW